MIYLDHAATTPVRPEVADAMAPYLTEQFGNPSGSHSLARAARKAVDDARETLASVLGCEPGEIVFTSGGTEADNLAVTGAALGALARGRAEALVCCSAVEHPAVREPVRFLGGIEIPVASSGVVDLEALGSVLAVEQEAVVLVSVMSANNETGVLQPLEEVSALAREAVAGVLVHTDAVQALAWLDVAATTASVDLVAVSAHKIGGPKGAGALVLRRGVSDRLSPILRGGPQERERRAGTENVAAIVGFAKAAELASTEREEVSSRVAKLTRRLVDKVSEICPDVVLAGSKAARLPSICNLGFPGLDAEELLLLLDQAGVAASAGSACASGALDPSPVLLAMGMSQTEAKSHVRFSLGASVTEDEIDRCVEALAEATGRLSG